ncbi:hypothetical protein [Bacillus sp. V5-8f]|uniref:hypothetical protein n=1 Tax=Bacillus sp. V5-8f TaxID=2053044 RepID=UPI000C771D1F|nr:hypothetical protein [Bacillus sp. V5-8f]PLT35743.1 hypothetical protein CUU64_00225 [Bacillus sp. V5-8f]
MLNKRASIALSVALLLTGCQASDEKKEDANLSQKAGSTVSEEEKNGVKKSGQLETDKEVRDFVLQHTSVKEIMSMEKRPHPKYPQEGIFHVTTGINKYGQKMEVWIQNGIVFEMNIMN